MLLRKAQFQISPKDTVEKDRKNDYAKSSHMNSIAGFG